MTEGMTMIERVARAINPDAFVDPKTPMRAYRRGVAKRQASAVLDAIEQAGFVIVPREPTRAMREAGYRAMMHTDFTGPQEAACWSAMLSSALSETGKQS
jgi:hypothetical protein